MPAVGLSGETVEPMVPPVWRIASPMGVDRDVGGPLWLGLLVPLVPLVDVGPEPAAPGGSEPVGTGHADPFLWGADGAEFVRDAACLRECVPVVAECRPGRALICGRAITFCTDAAAGLTVM
jgi:hypothetical protein